MCLSTLQYCTTYMHTVDIYVSELQNLLRQNQNYFAGSKTLKKLSEKSQNIKVLSFFLSFGSVSELANLDLDKIKSATFM